jgi:hypothetical protein
VSEYKRYTCPLCGLVNDHEANCENAYWPEPEPTIIANGQTLPPECAGDRYKVVDTSIELAKEKS